MAEPDPDLARDVDARCRLTGEFTLRSGQVSSEYFDKYLFETDPALLARVAAQMEPLLPEDVDLIGGLEMGGIPIVTALSARTGLPALVRPQAGQGVRHLQARRGARRGRPPGHADRGRDHHGRRRAGRDHRAA